MAQDRTQDRTSAAQVEMNDGASQGALVAPGQRQKMTVKQEQNFARQEMLADVEANKTEIMNFLATFGIEYDFFLGGLKVFLMQQMQKRPDFFTSVTKESFLEALFRCCKDGLIPDGKEAAIGHFKGVATYMPMRDGFVKVLWRTGLVKSINDQIVTRTEYERGWFKYIEGDNGYIEHQVDLERVDTDDTMAAYCVVELMTGGVIREVVTKSDLDKIAKMSKSPARGDWKFQMDRKAAIRRGMGKMPREKQIVQLLAHDDANFDNKLLGSSGSDSAAIPKDNLFDNKPAVRKRAEPKPLPEKVTEPETPAPGPAQEYDAAETTLDGALAGILVTDARHAETLEALAAIKAIALERADEMDAEGQDWVDETITARMAELAPKGGDAPEPTLRALLTTAAGVVVYDDADLWRDDILNKMSSVKADQLRAFWKANEQFIREAGEHHPEQSRRLLATARTLKLIPKEAAQ